MSNLQRRPFKASVPGTTTKEDHDNDDDDDNPKPFQDDLTEKMRVSVASSRGKPDISPPRGTAVNAAALDPTERLKGRIKTFEEQKRATAPPDTLQPLSLSTSEESTRQAPSNTQNTSSYSGAAPQMVGIENAPMSRLTGAMPRRCSWPRSRKRPR